MFGLIKKILIGLLTGLVNRSNHTKCVLYTNLATNTTLNAKINEVKNKIPNITNLATTAALTAVENNLVI